MSYVWEPHWCKFRKPGHCIRVAEPEMPVALFFRKALLFEMLDPYNRSAQGGPKTKKKS
jgi:hypothetical protein